ncbi:hypothetical protein GT2_04_02490 [Parageobacillus thermoglucosidasius NBRC 107763]|nr:hypothetical protein GT2_04_02490 [Parageobacillus thermoglucosidasius NBRC 107763]
MLLKPLLLSINYPVSVFINLKYGHRPVEEVMEELGEEVVLHFPALTEKSLREVKYEELVRFRSNLGTGIAGS